MRCGAPVRAACVNELIATPSAATDADAMRAASSDPAFSVASTRDGLNMDRILATASAQSNPIAAYCRADIVSVSGRGDRKPHHQHGQIATGTECAAIPAPILPDSSTSQTSGEDTELQIRARHL